ncbi:HNH endonuclease [Mycobacterium phage Molly]|nr:HNH endonuclease [Mycobacterium phage Molly]
MGLHDAIAWTPEMDSLIGTESDAKVGQQLGLPESRVRYRRIKLGLPTYRSSRAAISVECANCGSPTPRKQRDQRRSKNLYCSRECANAGQKKRDTDMLRYGAGWKTTRAKIRNRDRVCRCCGKTPEENGKALHVHHLIPFRFGGGNRPENLVALCDSCHHRIEALTNAALESIQVEVSLDGSFLTVRVDGQKRMRKSALGADFLMPTG